jgi:hypothetical protein
MTAFGELGPAFPAGVRSTDLFDAWMFAESDASLALAEWSLAPSPEKADAYAAYVAALDREAHAADVLASRLADEPVLLPLAA